MHARLWNEGDACKQDELNNGERVTKKAAERPLDTSRLGVDGPLDSNVEKTSAVCRLLSSAYADASTLTMGRWRAEKLQWHVEEQ